MKKAFSLFEFLIVMAVVFILALIIFPYYHTAREQLSLQRSAYKLAQDIRRAQEMAMAAEEYSSCGVNYGYGYGISFQTGLTSYFLFADCNNDKTYTAADQKVENDDIDLEGGVRIDILSPVSPLYIVFTPPDPLVTISGGSSAVVTLDNNGKTKTITVNKAGLIDVQ